MYDFFYNLIFSIKSVFNIITKSKLRHRPNIKYNSEDLVVLANGPSLRGTIEKYEQHIIGKNKLCVNGFALSDVFERLMPDIYVIADYGFWENNKSKRVQDIQESVKQALINKVTWPINMFIPFAAQGSNFVNEVSKNKNIKIHFYNLTVIRGFNRFSFYLYNRWYGIPSAQNVLIPSLIIGINLGFKKIFITGADHTWNENVWVDENNEVFIGDVHFYDEKVNARIGDNFNRKLYIYEFFASLTKAFKIYILIEKYAHYMNTKIYNASERSNIDAFERKKLNE